MSTVNVQVLLQPQRKPWLQIVTGARSDIMVCAQ